MRTSHNQNELIYGKIPPQAIDFEDAVIGACLIERQTFEEIYEVINDHEAFYKYSNSLIFKSICELYNSGNVIDIITVSEQLRKSGELEKVGGDYALSKLANAITSTAHAKNHAFVVMEKYMLRRMISLCGQAINDAYSPETDVFELMETTESTIRAITDGILADNAVGVGKIASEILIDLDGQKMRKTDLTGIDTGYMEINAVTNGWQKTEFVILAGRPSQGKTALALNFAMNAKCPTLIFSLESGRKQLVKRLIAARLNIPLRQVTTGTLNAFNEALLNKSISEFYKLPIKIDDKTRSLSNIIKSVRKEKKRNPGLSLVIVDYLQLVSVPKGGNREQEVSSISRAFKELAMDLDITVLALSQLNRDTEKTANKKPGLHNLRESGSLEQDCNIALFIWHEEMQKNADNIPVFRTWLIVGKNRDGECRDVELKFNGDIQRWLNKDDLNQGNPASILTHATTKNDIDWNNPF